MPITITTHEFAPEPQAVEDLARKAATVDGDPPFSDQTLVDLRAQRAGLRAVTATDGQELMGVALINAHTDEASTFTVELVVDPQHREGGVGHALAREVRNRVEGTLLAWAHGNHPGAQRLAEKFELDRVRDLHRLKRPLQGAEDIPLPVDLAEDLQLRAFQVGQDENAWLSVNSSAFAHHPEQGRMTLADLQERESEEWFDAAGFLLAVRTADPEDIKGFHWTKIHPASGDHGPMGEVYAVGVNPDQQGKGVGKALTAAGVNYLAEQGLDEVMLYVDGDNYAAMKLYDKLGFQRWHLDVMYRGESPS